MAYSYKRWLLKRENEHAPLPVRLNTPREESLIENVLTHIRLEFDRQRSEGFVMSERSVMGHQWWRPAIVQK